MAFLPKSNPRVRSEASDRRGTEFYAASRPAMSAGVSRTGFKHFLVFLMAACSEVAGASCRASPPFASIQFRTRDIESRRARLDPRAAASMSLRQFTTRFQIAAMIFMMVNAVVFGAGIVPVLMIPSLANIIPAVVIASFVVSAPLSWFIAPRLRARYWRTQSRHGGLESTSQ